MQNVSEADLASLTFTERDAILLSDSAQLDSVLAIANDSVANNWLIPLSTQAYAAVLRRQHARVRSYFGCVDFADCAEWYQQKGLTHARTWLEELGLGFNVENIDVVQLDAPCQFLLFTHARYIETTTERVIRANPDIDTFYVVTARDPLPLDFYFDSDVAAAVIQFVCERSGRRVRTISMERRRQFLHPLFRKRPMTDLGTELAGIHRMAKRGKPRVGIATATMPNPQVILEALRELGCQIVAFRSAWSGAALHLEGARSADEYIYTVAGTDVQESTAAASELADLRAAISDRSDRSTLPSSVIRNPHLRFQMDYLVERRWLSYANMIRHATTIVSNCPLDLFVLTDHFTAEGAILSHLYRRDGTRVLIWPHSAWPCDVNWATWESSDTAVMPSKSSAARLQALSGMRAVYVAGTPPTREYRSLLHARPMADRRKERAGGRKVVVVVTNALELNSVPFVDLQRHFEAVSKLAEVPPSLQSRVTLEIRTKPEPFGEDPMLYRKLCGLNSHGRSLLEGLSFSQVIDLADCVVGMNVPTTGYFEVLAKGVPLIQVRAAPVTTLHPDLPSEVTAEITDAEGMWPAIEAVLFDPDRRSQLLAVQRRFITHDLQPDAGFGDDPVVGILNRVISSRVRETTADVAAKPRSSDESPALTSRLEEPGGASHRGTGNVDDVLVAPDGRGLVLGWAADLTIGRPAKAVSVFFDGECLGTSRPTLLRPDVADALKDQRLLRSGFRMPVAFAKAHRAGTISVRAELHDGSGAELLATTIDIEEPG
jgi:hypothetical protein